MPAIKIHYDDGTHTTIANATSVQIDVGTSGYTHATKGVQKVAFDLDTEVAAQIVLAISDLGVPLQTWSMPFEVGQPSPLVLTWSTQAAITRIDLRIPAQTVDTYFTFFFLGSLDSFEARVAR